LPVYEFSCLVCKGTFDKFYKVDEKPLMTACDLCGVLNIRAVPIISPVRIGHIDQGRVNSVAFGREFKNERDMLQFAKSVGAEPIGDEPIENLEKNSRRQSEEKQEAFYKDLSEGIEWNTM